MASIPVEIAIGALTALVGFISGSLIPWLKKRYSQQTGVIEIVISSSSGEERRVTITREMSQKDIDAKVGKVIHEELS